MILLAPLALFLVLMVLRAPLFVALGLAVVVTLYLLPGAAMMPLAQNMIAAVDSFQLIAVPLFLLMGHLMAVSGLTGHLIDFAQIFVGRFRGGLGAANVGSSMFLAGANGSAIADLVAVGSVLIPSMRAQGYTAVFSAAISAASCIIGSILPPSILFVIYGIQTQSSVIDLFVAAIIPGLLISAVQIGFVLVLARTRNMPISDRVKLRQSFCITARAIPALGVPLIILAGVILGVFTVTESAGIVVVYALFFALLSGQLTPGNFIRALRSTAEDTAVIMILVSISGALAWIVAITRFPYHVADWLIASEAPLFAVLLAINLLMLFAGMILAPAAALVLIVPVLIPIATAYDVNLVHLGIIAVINLNLGLLTPPVAMANLIAARIAGISISEVQKEILPLVFLMILVLLVITFIPQLSLFLPERIIR